MGLAITGQNADRMAVRAVDNVMGVSGSGLPASDGGGVITSGLVRWAHGDAWQVEGLLRESVGGVASGIDHPQWNNADGDDPESADVVGMREWYAARSVPWGCGCRLVRPGRTAGSYSESGLWAWPCPLVAFRVPASPG